MLGLTTHKHEATRCYSVGAAVICSAMFFSSFPRWTQPSSQRTLLHHTGLTFIHLTVFNDCFYMIVQQDKANGITPTQDTSPDTPLHSEPSSGDGDDKQFTDAAVAPQSQDEAQHDGDGDGSSQDDEGEDDEYEPFFSIFEDMVNPPDDRDADGDDSDPSSGMVEEALKHIQQDKVFEAKSLLEKARELGSANASYQLGLIHMVNPHYGITVCFRHKFLIPSTILSVRFGRFRCKLYSCT